MSRIENAFERAKREQRAALVAYLCAGDPSLALTRKRVAVLFDAGADVVELGVPVLRPDRRRARRSRRRASGALQAGTTLRGVLDTVRGIRADDVQGAIVLMSYLNPLYAFGLERFASEAAAAGVDGVILPDLPLEQASTVGPILAAKGIELVLLAAPTTPEARLTQLGEQTRGFLYFVSVAGVTGARTALPSDLAAKLEKARAASKAPVAVGFGIAKPEQVRELSAHADGVVVGSAIVQMLHQGADDRALWQFVHSLREATERR